ncbi:MAG: hypothetical protein NTX86_06360 [Candidatus Dependentiae bacterium]|nr:hypothetical protein [Candidatus Dependentiae bacterium]
MKHHLYALAIMLSMLLTQKTISALSPTQYNQALKSIAQLIVKNAFKYKNEIQKQINELKAELIRLGWAEELEELEKLEDLFQQKLEPAQKPLPLPQPVRPTSAIHHGGLSNKPNIVLTPQ